jgi:hypothetical protein
VPPYFVTGGPFDSNTIGRLKMGPVALATVDRCQALVRRARGVVPGAVLAGVFKRSRLEYAQERGLALYWAHDLGQLTAWIAPTSTG